MNGSSRQGLQYSPSLFHPNHPRPHPGICGTRHKKIIHVLPYGAINTEAVTQDTPILFLILLRPRWLKARISSEISSVMPAHDVSTNKTAKYISSFYPSVMSNVLSPFKSLKKLKLPYQTKLFDLT